LLFLAFVASVICDHRNVDWEQLDVTQSTISLGAVLLPIVDQISNCFVWLSVENLPRWRFHLIFEYPVGVL